MSIDGRIVLLEPSDVGQEIVDVINVLLAALHSGHDAEHVTVDQLKLAAERSHVFLAYERGGQVIGMATLIIQERVAKCTAYAQDVVVLPEFEGQGFGSALVRELIAKAHEYKACHIDLTSSRERKRAHALYLKKGFKRRDTHNFRFVP